VELETLMPSLRLAFVGYYGMSNFGDDLFGQICLQSAHRYWPRTKSFVIHPTSGNRIYRGSSLVAKAARITSDLVATLRSDFVVLGGGSVISSQRSLGRALQYAVGDFLDVGFAGIGVSVGPFESQNDEENAAKLLRTFSFLSVRDIPSLLIANRMDLGYTPVMAGDLAGLYDAPAVARQEDVIGFAPCNYADHGDAQARQGKAQVHRALADAISETAARRKLKVRLLALNNHPLYGDDELVRHVAGRLCANGVETKILRSVDLGVEATWNAVTSCRAIVSVRLHGAVPAYLAGVPFALYEYHRKCSDFVVDVKQPADLRIDRNGATPERLSQLMEELLYPARVPAFDPATYRKRAVDGFCAAPWS
jgi:polysaccharide pyruvyl transferase WcaK-like protein